MNWKFILKIINENNKTKTNKWNKLLTHRRWMNIICKNGIFFTKWLVVEHFSFLGKGWETEEEKIGMDGVQNWTQMDEMFRQKKVLKILNHVNLWLVYKNPFIIIYLNKPYNVVRFIINYSIQFPQSKCWLLPPCHHHHQNPEYKK